MEKNRKNIDDLFKKELGNYTETPPPAVWDALEKRLDSTSPKPRTPYTWFGYFAMVSCLILVSVFVARNIPGNPNPAKDVAINGNTTATKGHEQYDNNKNSLHGNKPLNNTEPAKDNSTNQIAADLDNRSQNKIEDNKNNPTHNSLSEPAATTTNNQRPVIGSNNKTHSNLTTANNKKGRHHNSTLVNDPLKTKQHEAIADAGIQHTENIYNSGAAISNGPSNKITDKDETQAPNAPTNNNPTDNSTQKTNNNTHNPPPPPPPHKKFPRFEAGIKGGYESGFDNDASKKLLASPYLQYNITPKFSIMLQPAIKAASLNSRSICSPHSYYKANNDGTLKEQTDSMPVYVVGLPDTLWLWHYSYSQTHDSIVKTYVTGGTYVEFELPVLLKYYITKQFSVYGGVNIVYSKLTGVTENTYISNPISKTVTGSTGGPVGGTPPPVSVDITYTGTPYSSYAGRLYPAPQDNLLRFGYMLGFSYEFHKNWLFDALIQQTPVAPNIQAGFNVNNPVSAPYFRLTIGYKLIK